MLKSLFKFKNIDLTIGTPWKVIILYTLPIFVIQLLTTLFNIVDRVIIGQLLPECNAGISNANSLVNIAVGILNAGATGFSILTSQLFGKKDKRVIKHTYGKSITLGFLFGLVLTTLFMSFNIPMLNVLGISKAVDEVGYYTALIYSYIIEGCFVITVVNSVISNQLRAIGDSSTPMFVGILSNIVNALVTFLLVLLLPGYQAKVAGAAIATVLSQLISLIVLGIYAKKKYQEYFDIKKEHYKITEHHLLVNKLLLDAIPLIFENMFITLAMFTLQNAVISFDLGKTIPETGKPAHYAQDSRSAATNLFGFMNFGINSLSSAFMAYTAQNRGAKKLDRIKIGSKQSMIMMVILYALCVIIGWVGTINGGLIYVFLNPSVCYPETIYYFQLMVTSYATLEIFRCMIELYNKEIIGLGKPSIASLLGLFEFVLRILIIVGFRYWFFEDPNSKEAFICVTFADPIVWIPRGIITYIIAKKEFKKQELKSQALVVDK